MNIYLRLSLRLPLCTTNANRIGQQVYFLGAGSIIGINLQLLEIEVHCHHPGL